MPKKVFIGLNNIANVALSLKSGFEGIGIVADFYSNEKTLHKYDYNEESKSKINRITFSNFTLVRYCQVMLFFIKLVLRYDYFIFLQGDSLLSNFKDIKLLTKFGKKVSVIFAGCDVRVPEIVTSHKWNPCRDCSESYQKIVGCKFPEKYKRLEAIKKNFDIVFSPDECAGYFQDNYHTYYFPVIDINTKRTNEKYDTSIVEKIRIAHAPSNEDYKGSKYIYEVIESLKNKYDFDFVKFQNLSKEELTDEILKCDLVIDQMLVGFYGILSVEAMLLKKPVVCYIRDDIWNKINNICPIYNTNPDNLKRVLEEILLNPSQLVERGKNSRKYALMNHSPKKVADKMMKVFEE